MTGIAGLRVVRPASPWVSSGSPGRVRDGSVNPVPSTSKVARLECGNKQLPYLFKGFSSCLR